MSKNSLSSFKLASAVLAILLLPVLTSLSAAQTKQVFRVGWVTGGDPVLTARLEPFIAYLQDRLDVPVELFAVQNGAALIDAIVSDQIEYAALTGSGFAVGQSLCDCLVPLASPSTTDGLTHLRSVLLAKAGTIMLEEPEFLAGPPSDFLTHHVPAFAQNAGEISARLVETTSLEMVLNLVADGDERPAFAWTFALPDGSSATADALSGFAAVLTGQNPSLEVAWQSDAFRMGAHSVHQSVPDVQRQKLVAALLDIKTASPVAFDVISPSLDGGFVAAGPDDYANYLPVLAVLTDDG
ncbi:MAG: PhnD/SsuA/transferrin family substrate-binding protein [Pseudomonadota bacterium]